jgi:hypothetical protein
MSSSTEKWYSRVTNFEQPLHCPRCAFPYVAGPLFDHDPRIRQNCGITIIEWFLFSVVYVIDIERAPEIVKTLVNYMQPLIEPDAYDQLLSLLIFLDVDAVVSLYSPEESLENEE